MGLNLYEQQRSNRRRTWLIVLAFIAFFVLLGAGFDAFAMGEAGEPVPVGTVLALTFGSLSAAGGYFFGDRAVLASSHAVPLHEWAAANHVRTTPSAGSSPDEDGNGDGGSGELTAADLFGKENLNPLSILHGATGEAVAGADAAAPAASAATEELRLKQLQNVVDEMAIASGLPRPRIYIIPDEDPNAFATGRDPAHASLAVTDGLLTMMSRDELQGVVAHEMGHIKNYDIRLMTVIAALVGAIGLLSDWTRRGWLYGGRGSGRSRDSKDRGGGLVLLVIWVVAIIIAPILAQLAAMAVSRRREYLADASGAELTRNPLGLAGALEKIEGAVAPTRMIKTGTAHLCIADPQGHPIGQKEGFLADLLATHPPMAKRIAALKEMAFQYQS